MNKNDLLIKYAPKTLDDLRLPKRINDLLLTNIDKVGYRFLLHGSPGTGKTSTSKILAQSCDALYLSGSNDFNIETMRTKIYPYVSGHSVINKPKLVIIDEAENMRNNIQDAFKIVLDQAKKVNFIFITNEIEGMNDAIKSRCTNIEYNYQLSEIQEQYVNYAKFVMHVLKEENIQSDEAGRKELMRMMFPDFRHLLVTLQQFVDSKQPITLHNVNLISENGVANIELYEALNIIDAQKFYEEIGKFKGKERECLISLGEPFFKWLGNQGKWEQIIKVAPAVSKHCNHFVTSMNKFGTFFACCSELKSLIR